MDRLHLRAITAGALLLALAVNPDSVAAQARMSGGTIADRSVVRSAGEPLPSSSLAVMRDGEWREWWRSASAPAEWPAPDEYLLRALKWRAVADGVEWAEVRVSGSGEAWRLKLIVARLDPARVQFGLDTAFN